MQVAILNLKMALDKIGHTEINPDSITAFAARLYRLDIEGIERRRLLHAYAEFWESMREKFATMDIAAATPSAGPFFTVRGEDHSYGCDNTIEDAQFRAYAAFWDAAYATNISIQDNAGALKFDLGPAPGYLFESFLKPVSVAPKGKRKS